MWLVEWLFLLPHNASSVAQPATPAPPPPLTDKRRHGGGVAGGGEDLGIDVVGAQGLVKHQLAWQEGNGGVQGGLG